jgi:hypothetical protein
MPHTLSVDSAWRSTGTDPIERLVKETADLGARFGVWASVESRAGRLEINATLISGQGPVQARVEGDTGEIVKLANQLGRRLADLTAGKLVPAGVAQHDQNAVIEYMRGEAAVERDAWLTAEQHYERALAYDTTFLLAAWRLGTARRWMPLRSTPPFPANFRDLFARYAQDLPRNDSLLIEAQFAPSGAARFAVYDSALAADSLAATAMLLFGDELFHRGPLAGRSLTEAVAMLHRATTANASLAPAW